MEPHNNQNYIKEIIKKIKSSQNGPASEAMSRLGLNYKLNYGVSSDKLKDIAIIYHPNSLLAKKLLEQDIRETKILAYMIFDYNKLTISEIKEIASTIDNHELAEQFALALTKKNNSPILDIDHLFMSNNEYLLTSLYLMVSKYAQTYKTGDDKYFLKCIKRTDIHTGYDNIHLSKAISKALRNIALRNDGLKNEIVSILSGFKKKNVKHFDLIYEEVVSLLNYQF